jgi:hypothetical protein
MLDLSGRVSDCADGHVMNTSLTVVLRKAAYPLPTGDCDQSLIRLQYLAGDGWPGSTTVYLIPRKAKDIKKHPTGRGPTARVKRNNLGSSQATPAQGDMSDLPGSDSACVMNSSRHKVSFQSKLQMSDPH